VSVAANNDSWSSGALRRSTEQRRLRNIKEGGKRFIVFKRFILIPAAASHTRRKAIKIV